MGIKKIARPINKAKNEFLKWLKDNDADYINGYESEDTEWSYYRNVTAFIGNDYYMVTFMLMNGNVRIDFWSKDETHDGISINEFLELLK